MSFEDRLRNHLHSSADGIGVPDEPYAGRSRRSRPPLTAIGAGLAVLVLVGGFAFLVGRNTASDPVGDTTVAELAEAPPDREPLPELPPPAASGDQLSWDVLDTVPDVQFFSEVVAVDDGYLALGFTMVDEADSMPDTVILESADGRSWSAAAPPVAVPEFGGLHAMAAAGDRLILAGSVLEEPVEEGPFRHAPARPLVYVSQSDGEWLQVELPVELPDIEFNILQPHTSVQTVAASENLAVAFGTTFFEPDFEKIASEALGEEFEGTEFYGWGFDGTSVEIMGPGGIRLAEVSLAELAATPEERRLMAGHHEEMHIWRSVDFETFELVEVTGLAGQLYVQSAGTLPDGRIYVTGHSEYGPDAWASADGLTWEPAVDGIAMSNALVRHGDGWLASSGYEGVDLRYRPDGGEWTEIPLDQLLPEDGRRWNVGMIHSGGLGVVAEVWGYVETEMFTGPPVVEIEKDGYLIELREDSGIVTVKRDGETLITATSLSSSDAVRYDLEGNGIEFLDAETGDVLVTVSGEEFDEAQRLTYEDFGPGDEENGFLFSPDLVNWSFQPMSGLLGDRGGMQMLEVGDDFVLGAVWRWDGAPSPESPPSAELWIGTKDG